MAGDLSGRTVPVPGAENPSSTRVRDLAKQAAWRVLYRRWPSHVADAEGYTILMPVPGDLPVFTHLALAGLARQDPAHRAEVIVIPDRVTPELQHTFGRSAALFPSGTVRLVGIGSRARTLQPLPGDPSLNHFLQIFHGVNATRTAHALLHDADLFINDVGFLATRYRECADDGLACLGVELVYNNDWYERQGLGPILATWELMFEVGWLQSFPPWLAHLHDERINGTPHAFDTMDYPQAHTPQGRRRLAEAPDEFVHFRQVISVFSRFQRARGEPYEDQHFRLLLVRLLTDALGDANGRQPIPPVEELTRGIADASAPVTYRSEGIESNYSSFRRMLRGVTSGPLIAPERAEDIERALAPFDAAFG